MFCILFSTKELRKRFGYNVNIVTILLFDGDEIGSLNDVCFLGTLLCGTFSIFVSWSPI